MIIAAISLPALANQVNLNSATRDELLNGISGLSSAQADAIIAYRDKEGAFMKVPELLHIGIGREIIEPNYQVLTVGGATASDKKTSRLE